MRQAMPRAGWLAVGAIAGALAAVGLGSPWPAIAALASVAVATAACHALGRRRACLVGVGALLILARAIVGGAAGPTGPHGTAGEGQATDTAQPAGGYSAAVVALSAPQGGQQRAILELLPPAPPDRLYAWLPRYPQIAPHDQIQFSAALEPAPDDTGFGQFLARSGVGHTARIRAFEVVSGGETALAELEDLRRAGGDLLAVALPAPQSGLAAGLLIGLRDLVPRDVANDFRTAGMSHIVAISGFHLALVAALAGLCLRSLGRRARSAVLLVLIWSYVLVAGAPPSVIRAALMATVVIGAREAGRAGQAGDALGIAALVMLFADPHVVEEPGFQLSLSATAGLLVWATPFAARLRSLLPVRTPPLVVEGMAVSLAAQAATLPLVLLHFGRLSTVAPLANLLATPLVAPAMIAAGIALAAAGLVAVGVPAVLMAPFSLAGAVALGTLIGVARLCASLPLASVELAPPLDLAGALVATGLVGLLLRRTRSGYNAAPSGGEPRPPQRAPEASGQSRIVRHRLRLAAAIGCLFVAAAAVGGAQPDGRFHMIVLDVGQGDAILLQGPRGGRVLVDTGPDPELLLVQLDARLPAWDRRLDLVLLSHPHEDHVAGLALLLDRYRIGAIAETGMIGLGPGDAAYRRRLAELGRETRILAAGDRLDLDGVRIDVRWPLPGRVPLRPADGGKAVNNVSIVLDIAYGQRRFLLTGDVEEQIDPQLLALGLAAEGRPLDVLKVAHHGSRTATTDAFVERLSPSVAVISAGWGNPYGHPSPQTVERLREAGAALFRTDLDGSVAVSTDGRDLRADASGGRSIPTRPVAFTLPGIGFCPIPAVSAAGP